MFNGVDLRGIQSTGWDNRNAFSWLLGACFDESCLQSLRASSPRPSLLEQIVVCRAAMPLLKKAAFNPDLTPPQLNGESEVLVLRFTGQLCSSYE